MANNQDIHTLIEEAFTERERLAEERGFQRGYMACLDNLQKFVAKENPDLNGPASVEARQWLDIAKDDAGRGGDKIGWSTAPLEDYKNVLITELGLAERVVSRLRPKTIGQLASLRFSQLRGHDHFGDKAFLEVFDAMRKIGFEPVILEE